MNIFSGQRAMNADHQTTPPPQLSRITREPRVMEGRACIQGMRVTVGMIVGQIGAERTTENVLADFPYLEREDVFEALQYAAWLCQKKI